MEATKHQTTPRFCKDCAHFLPETENRYASCAAPSVATVDLVHGIKPRMCELMRKEGAACGVSAGFFQPAEKTESKEEYWVRMMKLMQTPGFFKPLVFTDSASAPTPVFIYGKAGCGKTLNAALLAKHYGKDCVIEHDAASPIDQYPSNAIVFSNVELPGSIAFNDAMAAAVLTTAFPSPMQQEV